MHNLASIIQDAAATGPGRDDAEGGAGQGLTFRLSDGSTVSGLVDDADAEEPWVRVWPGPDAADDAEDVPQIVNVAHIVRVQWTSHAHQ